uniref:glutathione transferase n=1 Tax=Plectus sambesii TaxID=2011161 RepID=A0A914XB96_9BILA
MPSYKLYYFNVRGRGEFLRYMLLNAGIPFEDFRIDSTITPGQWDTYKPKMPMGQVPVLEIDGKEMLPQSCAIGRYLAKQTKTYGANDLEAAHIDAIVDLANDIYPKVRPVIMAMFQKNNDLKQEEWGKVRDDVSKQIGFLENTLKTNGSGWLVGKSVSMADFFVGEFIDRLVEKVDPKIVDDAPHVKELVKKVAELPKIKEYIATRPQTTF